MLIAGDIGGTKTDLALFSSEAGPHVSEIARRYQQFVEIFETPRVVVHA